MKDYVLELIAKQSDITSKFNIMREYLQAYILRIVHNAGLFRTSAFVGGTALRFLHDLRRFSEDLDFSLAKAKEIQFSALMKKVEAELALSGYNVASTVDDESVVRNALFKFEGLTYEAGISPHKSQKFTVKVEIDTNPPEGAILESKIVSKYFPIDFLTYDLPSLFAGKLSAVLTREYAKGRDFYDLFWYLTKHKELAPNFTLLNNAMAQTVKNPPLLTPENWREEFRKTVKRTNFAQVRQDVSRFLERPEEAEFLELKTFESLLK